MFLDSKVLLPENFQKSPNYNLKENPNMYCIFYLNDEFTLDKRKKLCIMKYRNINKLDKN